MKAEPLEKELMKWYFEDGPYTPAVVLPNPTACQGDVTEDGLWSPPPVRHAETVGQKKAGTFIHNL